MKNQLSFKNGKVRILQVSDPQDLKYVRRAMVEMLDTAYDTLSPDLVLFTGDNILGNHLLDARIGNKKVAEGAGPTLLSMRAALAHILDPVYKRKIPFAMIYGNHDDMNVLSKDEQMKIYRAYPTFMEGNVDNPSLDCDTYTIELKGEDGKTKYCLYMLDSAWQDMDEERKCHQEVTKETVEWLKGETEKNKGIPSMLFLHIPLPEQEKLTTECTKDDEDALECDGVYRKLNPAMAKGCFKEPISILEESNGVFEVIKDGEISAVVTGHDHRNCFEGTYDGVDFIQTGCASFRCYGDIHTRGVRIIDIYEDGRYETKFLTYFDICGKSPYTYFRNFIDADEFEYIKFGSLGALTILTAAGITARAIRKKLKK